MQSNSTFNIGDVSQQTGVPAVTLRAWERRHGLVKPQRTPKGHRLYSQADIEEVNQIVSWLNRGVAISKIAALLASNEVMNIEPESDNPWLQIQQELFVEIIKLKQRGLNQRIDQLNKSMPFVSLCENVYQPLQHLLQDRWQTKVHGYQLELQLWQQSWQRQITLMTLRADKQKSHTRCTLVNLDLAFPSLDYWLFYGLLLQSGVSIDSINNIQDITCLNRLNQTTEQAIILFADRRLDTIETKQLFKLARSWSGSFFCTGRMAKIHNEQFTELGFKFKGGSASYCWQSAKFQAWLASIRTL